MGARMNTPYIFTPLYDRANVLMTEITTTMKARRSCTTYYNDADEMHLMINIIAVRNETQRIHEIIYKGIQRRKLTKNIDKEN